MNGDDIVKWLGFGIDHAEFQKKMQQLSLKLQGTDSGYYNSHFNFKKKHGLRFELFKLAHFKSIAEQAPAFESDWIFVDVEFCREGYDQSLKITFVGTPPYGLKMDFTASDCMHYWGSLL